MRLVEDLGWSLSPWSNVVRVTVDPKSHRSIGEPDAQSGVTASIVLRGQQNVNGLGHGASNSDVLIGRASAGVLLHASLNPVFPSELQVSESVQLGSTINNPTYFADLYAEATGRDASGYVLAGLLNAAEYPTVDEKDPVVVWMVQPLHTQEEEEEGMGQSGWNRTVVFQDDGNRISSASTAVLIAIDPSENGGRKQAWLFVTGPLSKAVVAARIDL
ncbi:MAG: hypothetical protein M1822_006815 [Bathelium mastoideum]|nr:MAG: hypothetical protein M1822_006815 [Bathelium mastoideum]